MQDLQKIRTKSKYGYVIACLLALLVMPIYSFGARVAVIALVAVVTALACDLILGRCFKYEREKGDISSVITALVITLLMSATVSYTTVVIAVLVALGIAKYPFGGTKHNIFNPAAVGVAVVALSFPEQVLVFPANGQALELGNEVYTNSSIIFQNTPASIMNVGGTPALQGMTLLLGDFAGAIGATGILVLVISMIFLLATRIISMNVVCGALATVILYACLLPRVSTGTFDSVVYELCSGVLLFGIIFMSCDPSTTPKTRFGRLLYGVMLALITMIFRSIGALDVEFVFVLLILNATSKEFDRISIRTKYTLRLITRARNKKIKPKIFAENAEIIDTHSNKNVDITDSKEKTDEKAEVLTNA